MIKSAYLNGDFYKRGGKMKFITIILLIPILVMFLYSAMYPRESFLMGKRWQYKNENLEPSEEAIKQTRVASTIGIIIIILSIVIILFS